MPVICRLTLSLASVVVILACQVARAEEKEVIGWIEKVKIFPANIVVQAKLDTGADYSSLNASNIQEFEKNNRKMIKFEVTNRYGQKATIEREIVRIAMVKKHFGKAQRRPVVRLGICVGSRYMDADVNLVDRTNFENQMLIGRSFMAGNLLLDPAMTFTAEPSCTGATKH